MSGVGRIVKHYKGGRYIIIGHGREEASRAAIVIYKQVDNYGWEDLYTRPYNEFYGVVDVEGQVLPRFQFVN